LNAADEVAVAAFLEGRIPFDEIPGTIGSVLSDTKAGRLESIQQVLKLDAEARGVASEYVKQVSRIKAPVVSVSASRQRN